MCGGEIIKKIVFAIALSCAIVFLMYFASSFGEDREVIEVAAVMPLKTGIIDSVVLRGNIIEKGRKDVFAASPGVINTIHVKTGEYVKAGQILMDLTPIQEESKKTQSLISEIEQRMASVNPKELLENYEEQIAALPNSIKTPSEIAQPYSLFSPINGIVMDIYSHAGDSVSGFFPCIAVSDMKKLGVRAQIGESNLSKIKEGMSCIVTVDALTGEKKLSGKVESIMPYAKQTGIFEQNPQVKTDVIIGISPQNDLRPGYSAAVKIATAKKENVLLIPYNAVLQDKNALEYIYTVQNGLAIKQYIETGYELEEGVEVLNMPDLAKVILDGDGLKHGSHVKVSDAK